MIETILDEGHVENDNVVKFKNNMDQVFDF